MDFVGNIHDRAPPPPPAYRPRPQPQSSQASKPSSSSTSSAYANSSPSSPPFTQPTPSASTIQGQNRNSNDGKGTFYDLIKYKDSLLWNLTSQLLRDTLPLICHFLVLEIKPLAESTPLHPTNTKPGIKDTTLEKTVLTNSTEIPVQIPDKSTTENNTERPNSRDFCYSAERNELKKENHNLNF